MIFSINSIQLWLKRDYSPNSNVIRLDFFNDKVNVITGDASTGKSSILDIIDYCLLSDSPNIVEDIINENVKCYGMAFSINHVDYILIRESPQLERGTQKVYWGTGNNYPDNFVFDKTIAEVKVELDKLFQIPEIHLKSGRGQTALSYRHFLPLNYLTEDIISSANVYFDTAFFESKDFDNILDTVVELANGVNLLHFEEVKEHLESLNKELEKYQNAHRKAVESNRTYLGELKSIFDKAVSLGIVDVNNIFIRENSAELKRYVQQAITMYDRLVQNDEQTQKLNKIKKHRDAIKEKLSIYESLFSEIKVYKQGYNRLEDSLKPITYIRKHINEIIKYPETGELINLLDDTFRRVRGASKVSSELPEDFVSRYEQLKKELHEAEDELKKLNNFRSKITNPSWLNNALDVKYRLKNLKQPLKDDYEKTKELEMEECIKALTIEKNQLEVISNPNEVWEDLDASINRYFDSQDGVSGSYKGAETIYDKDNRRLLLRKKGEDIPIKNIGSKSNYMFLHLCFFLGLHELLLKNKSQQVPAFLFVDQPSIPYYGDKQTLSNNDKEQLMKAFNMLDYFIERMTQIDFKRHFQIILIEHAEETYWNDLKHFQTVAKFEKDGIGGLIPKYVYEEK